MYTPGNCGNSENLGLYRQVPDVSTFAVVLTALWDVDHCFKRIAREECQCDPRIDVSVS
jgi:hypothetical protein